MLLVRTPYRVSLFGGGTDYPEWIKCHGGQVLSTTIDKYCWIWVRHLPPFFPYKYSVVYSKIEQSEHVKDIQHPAVRGCLQALDWPDDSPIGIHHDGDLPARSGIGSSSAFTVGLLNGLLALRGQQASREELAKRAIYVEQTVLQERVGAQDQIATAYGGLNRIVFAKDGEFSINPVTISGERLRQLNSKLHLFYVGPRIGTASDVAKTYDMDGKRAQLRLLHTTVDEAVSIICGGGSLSTLGELFHDTWMLKRALSGAVTDPHIDGIYARARAAGALGGKLLGAGGGGLLLLYIEDEGALMNVHKTLAGCMHVPFLFEREGSRIVYYQP